MSNKRDIFTEIAGGFQALSEEREGKRTLRKHKVELKKIEPATPQEIQEIRRKLKVSQPVFASVLHTNKRTLEKWEQGISKPNDQATTLIRLVEKFPDMIEKLAAI